MLCFIHVLVVWNIWHLSRWSLLNCEDMIYNPLIIYFYSTVVWIPVFLTRDLSFFLHLKNTFETYFRQNHFVSVTTSTLSDFDVDVHFKPCTRYDPYSLLFFFPLSVWSALSPKEFHRFWCESCVEFPQWELCIFRSNSLERFSQSLPYRQLYIYIRIIYAKGKNWVKYQ